ncbi:MAG: hypothetical protein HQ510_12170 [Candidatus Marinimicrobia bacterium]|nr:hypothetical protein [Candidatus Neomarinimicrobiota bacterium]
MRITSIILLLLFAGCDSGTDPNDSGDIIVTISSDKSSFSSLDPVELNVTVENNTDADFTLYPVTSCALFAEVIIGELRYQIIGSRICLQFAVPIVIEPGDSYSESWQWDGAYSDGENLEHLQLGIYEIIGVSSSELESNQLSLEYAGYEIGEEFPDNSVFMAFQNSDDSTGIATFTLGNTTTDTYQYSGYSDNYLFYHTQYLNDDSWDYIFFNWCGTGVESFDLIPETFIDFQVPNPNSSCIWRVRLQIWNVTQETMQWLYSDEVEF